MIDGLKAKITSPFVAEVSRELEKFVAPEGKNSPRRISAEAVSFRSFFIALKVRRM